MPKTAKEAHAALMSALPVITHLREPEISYDPLTGRRKGDSESASAIRNRRIARERKPRSNTWIGNKPEPQR